jgi:hypothetical protein
MEPDPSDKSVVDVIQSIVTAHGVARLSAVANNSYVGASAPRRRCIAIALGSVNGVYRSTRE